jgi:hypothetical protein
MSMRNRILPACLVFASAYFLFLLMWIQIKPYYGSFLTYLGAHLAGATAGLELDKINHDRDVARITYARTVMSKGNVGEVLLDLRVSVSNYSFNVPLSFAMAAGLFVFFKWRWRYIIEISVFLILVHILYIYSYCTLNGFKELSKAGLEDPSAAVQFLLQFIWAFTDNMVIRFEPFLVAAYLWLRNRASHDETGNAFNDRKGKR